MFTVYFQFHKPCLNGFSELEMESAMNVLEAIKNNPHSDVDLQYTIDYGCGYARIYVLMRAVDIVDFIIAREDTLLNLKGRGFNAKVLGTEIYDSDYTEEDLLEGELEQRAVKKVNLPRLRFLLSKLSKKGKE